MRNIYMERTKLNELKCWYAKNRKPLVVWGARQVGKTYLVKDLFAKKEFKNFVYIDLKKDDEARDFLPRLRTPKKYLGYIEARYGKKITEKCPAHIRRSTAMSSSAFRSQIFQAGLPELPVIATGSMVRLSIKHEEKPREGLEKDEFLFPVGAIDSLNVYPLNFEEYLLNTNKILLKNKKRRTGRKKAFGATYTRTCA